MLGLFNDFASTATKAALSGLGKRQELISNNIANADTPMYHAMNIEFEHALNTATRSRDGHQPLQATVTNSGHISPLTAEMAPKVTRRADSSMRLDGNNVDVDLEMTRLAETNLLYQTMTQIETKKLSLIRALTGR
jgi:flagellar basal-body rod protein FlgB